MISSTLLLFIFTTAAVAQAPAMICMTNPAFSLMAGAAAKARISSASARNCQATLSFVDDNFLPVHFNVKATACEASLEVELAIIIPDEVPKGDASLSWVCAGDATPSCARVILTGGQADSDNLEYTQQAFLSCVSPQSTLTTLTSGAVPTQTFSLRTQDTWTSTFTVNEGIITANTATTETESTATNTATTETESTATNTATTMTETESAATNTAATESESTATNTAASTNSASDSTLTSSTTSSTTCTCT